MLEFLTGRLVVGDVGPVTVVGWPIPWTPTTTPATVATASSARALYRLNHFAVESGRPMIGAMWCVV